MVQNKFNFTKTGYEFWAQSANMVMPSDEKILKMTLESIIQDAAEFADAFPGEIKWDAESIKVAEFIDRSNHFKPLCQNIKDAA